VELHKVPETVKGTWVRVLEESNGPPNAPNFKPDDLILYFHIDGMYSSCKDRAGQIVYLKAWTEVEVVGHE